MSQPKSWFFFVEPFIINGCLLAHEMVHWLYKSEYPIKEILDFAAQMPSNTKKCFIYFNNTWGTGALNNAKQLQGLVATQQKNYQL